MRHAKAPIPLSSFTNAEWEHPAATGPVHRLKRDPDGYLCQVSLCGLTVTPGAGRPWVRLPQRVPAQRAAGRAARERRICPECERAAKEVAE